MNKLSPDEINERIGALPEWTRSGDSIQRTFRFENFLDSMAFVNRVANLAEQKQHHPDIMIRYNKVTLTLVTHDAGDSGGLTTRDFDFATMSNEMIVTV